MAKKPEKPIQKTDKPADKKAENPVDNRALNTVVTRNAFYRDGYRNLMKLAMVEGIAIIGLIIALIATVMVSQPQDRFFATTSDGRLIRMVPLSQPNLNDSALLSWAAKASSEIMTFGFHDYQRRLQESSIYFTRRGWQSFTDALDRSGRIDGMENGRQVMTAAAQSAPIIIQKGEVNGVYRWVVELPILLTTQSGGSQQSDVINVRLVIVRVSTLDNPSGIGIQQWIAR